MIYIIAIILGYLIGSIPFALVIGKVFYHTDIRQFGSGNLGGTNAGRILGKKAGIAVIACDLLKCAIPVYIISLFNSDASIWCGLAVCVGHCFPLFANFKGGKAAASMMGFLLSISLFTVHNLWAFIIPVLAFFLVLFISKMVSLASMSAACASTITLLCLNSSWTILIASILMSALIIERHRPNIKRILAGNERKITWLDKKS